MYKKSGLLGQFVSIVFENGTFTSEQETVVREDVKKKPIASVILPRVKLNVGSTVPEIVELHTIDAPDITYRYVVVDNRPVLADPSTRTIVRVLN